MSRHRFEAAPPEICDVPEFDGPIATAAVEPVSVDCQRPDGTFVSPASGRVAVLFTGTGFQYQKLGKSYKLEYCD